MVVNFESESNNEILEQLIPAFPNGDCHALISKNATCRKKTEDGKNRGHGIRSGFFFSI